MMDKTANCRALTILCAAADRARLAAIKRAAVAAEWEVVGGAVSLDELLTALEEVRPNVVVLDAALGQDAAIRAREILPQARIVGVGPVPGVDAVASTLAGIRDAILGRPPGS
jgi:chemotaxis response regulator CheB